MTAPHSPRLYSLWPSHVLIDQLDELEDVRESLAQQAEFFYERHTQNVAKLSHRADTVSMMREQPSNELLRLLACIEDKVANYIRRAYPSLDPADLNLTYNTFVNRQRGLGKWAIPHRHVGNQLVATYYPRVLLGSLEGRDAVGMPGALCFHDPRPVQANWMLRHENKLFAQTPLQGALFIFPGYLEHSTFPLLDVESDKVAIVTNVRFTHRDDSGGDQTWSAEQIRAHAQVHPMESNQ
jgi:hypothetical protein